jgi:multidrug efflux pump subunit AcrB
MRARGLALIGLIGLSDLSAACRQNAAVAAAPLTPVGVSAIGTRNVGNRTPYSAAIVPYSQVDLAFKSGGYVESILQVKGADGRVRNIQEGDWVARGTVLARVRESDYVANVNVAKAQLAQAKAAAEQARLDFDRTDALFRTDSVTTPQYDAARAKLDFRTIRALASQVEDILRSVPVSARVRDDWNDETTAVSLEIDPDRANVAGVSNLDVALASSAAMSGMPVTTLREGNKEIPVIAQLRMEERAQLSDIQNLYVYSSTGTQKIPLSQVSHIQNTIQTRRIRRQEHFRTISVSSFPVAGALASDVLNAALPRLTRLAANLPPGYTMQISGEQAKQQSGLLDLVMVLGISVFLIYLALLIQFDHAVKPFLVFAAAPYGVVGALLALAAMGTPFGFMAFLGIVSLVGVIVSHIIVLFDFIEEMHEKGEPLEQALIDAGIERLRRVMITVAATVLALFPLALDGGPLWQPLCYAQIGGLSVATFVTLLLVPVLYSIACWT